MSAVRFNPWACLAGVVGPHVPVGTPQLGREDGVAALVLKPSALGGFERTLQLAAWARRRCSSLDISVA